MQWNVTKVQFETRRLFRISPLLAQEERSHLFSFQMDDLASGSLSVQSTCAENPRGLNLLRHIDPFAAPPLGLPFLWFTPLFQPRMRKDGNLSKYSHVSFHKKWCFSHEQATKMQNSFA